MLSGPNALFVSTCDKRCCTSLVVMVKVERFALVRTGTGGVERSGSGTVILLEKTDASTSALSLLLVATVPSDM